MPWSKNDQQAKKAKKRHGAEMKHHFYQERSSSRAPCTKLKRTKHTNTSFAQKGPPNTPTTR